MEISLVDVLDRTNPEPLYIQIKNWMLQEIESGRWPVHYKLPAEEDLAHTLGVSRGTLRQALRELIAARRLIQIHGKGTFVTSSQEIEEPLARDLLAFSEGLIQQNIPFRTEVLDRRVMIPDTRIAAFLHLRPDEPVFYLKRRRFVNDVPIILTENYVALSLCADIEHENFTEQRLFQCLEERFGLHLDWAQRTFEARAATPEQAILFNIPVGSPLMYIEQIVYLQDGRSIECSDVWLRGDRFKLPATVSRSAGWTAVYKG